MFAACVLLTKANTRNIFAQVPNLVMVETVDNEKLAKFLNRACTNANRTEPLQVMVQVAPPRPLLLLLVHVLSIALFLLLMMMMTMVMMMIILLL